MGSLSQRTTITVLVSLAVCISAGVFLYKWQDRPTVQWQHIEAQACQHTRLIPHDAYFTWSEYEIAMPESAVYSFNGIEVGHGRAGFSAVLERIHSLSSDMQVLVYPLYPLDNVDTSAECIHFPFHDSLADLNEAANASGTTLVFAQYDHEGNACLERDSVALQNSATGEDDD